MILSSTEDIRRVAILAGALPHDLIQPATGLIPLARADIDAALRASNTVVRSRGWLRFLVGASSLVAAIMQSIHVEKLLPDKKNLSQDFSQITDSMKELRALHNENKLMKGMSSEKALVSLLELKPILKQNLKSGQKLIEIRSNTKNLELLEKTTQQYEKNKENISSRFQMIKKKRQNDATIQKKLLANQE